MRLSFSTNAYGKQSVYDAIVRIADIGYEGVELLADAPHLNPLLLTPSDLEKIGSLLTQKGLLLANINANTSMCYYGRSFWEPLFEPSLSNPDPEGRRWRIDCTKRCIDMAYLLGAPGICITSGKMVPGIQPAASLELLRASLSEILEYAHLKGIRIGVEYEPGLLIERCSELLDLFARIDSDLLGANLDLGHSYLIDNDLTAVITALATKIFHIHIEDIRDMKHYHLVPGEGDMDFKAIYHALIDVSYHGFVSVELYTYLHDPDGAARRSLEVLRPLGFSTMPELIKWENNG